MMPQGRVQDIQRPVVVAGFLPCMQGANGSLYHRNSFLWRRFQDAEILSTWLFFIVS